jgi:tRNA 2-thiocytidine biosynthesis protein TtcA
VLNPIDRITKLTGKAIADFDMIRTGDRIAVGLSGGKDSLALLHALLALKTRAPVAFELAAFTIQQGKFMGSLDGLQSHLCALGIRWELVEDQPSLRLVKDRIEHGCDICSRYRRRAVYEIARQMQCNVVAFGHTADDFAEAMVRNLVFTGKVKPLPPVTMSSKTEFRLIRPLVYVKEEWIRERASMGQFPIVQCVCSLKEGSRMVVRGFLEQISNKNPHIYGNIIGAGIRAWRGKVTEPAEDDSAFVEI